MNEKARKSERKQKITAVRLLEDDRTWLEVRAVEQDSSITAQIQAAIRFHRPFVDTERHIRKSIDESRSLADEVRRTGQLPSGYQLTLSVAPGSAFDFEHSVGLHDVVSGRRYIVIWEPGPPPQHVSEVSVPDPVLVLARKYFSEWMSSEPDYADKQLQRTCYSRGFVLLPQAVRWQLETGKFPIANDLQRAIDFVRQLRRTAYKGRGQTNQTEDSDES